jgi:dolichyl-phosphate-mannose--protein O-mannosyl transferase
MVETVEALGARAIRAATSRWTRWDTVALGTVTIVALVVRLIRLSDPHAFIFDEVYYAKDACWYTEHDLKLCGISSEITWVHPPLAKWLIGLGIKIFGFHSFGYRIVPVIAGTLVVALTYLVARKLLSSTVAATLASGLLAFDFMEFVQSRTSMLDIFVPLFGMAAFYFLLRDRDRMETRAESPRGFLHLTDRPWRLAAGLAVGAATASKWNGGLLWIAVVVLTVVWEVAARRESRDHRPFSSTMRQEGISIVVLLLVAPVLLYGLTYVGRLGDIDLAAQCRTYEPGTGCATVPDEAWPVRLVDLQIYMEDFHRTLSATHSYESPPWSWLLIKRPVSYYFCPGSDHCPENMHGNYSEIMTLGSPFAWWAGILALVFVTVVWVRGVARSSRRGGPPMWRRPEGLILAGFCFAYLPWFGLANNRPAQFIFYMLPAIPFLYLALAYAGMQLGRSWEARAARALFAAITVSLFGFYYPLLADVSIPRAAWQQRIWIFDNCEVTKTHPTTTTVTSTSGSATVVKTQTTNTTASEPPDGWCWI